MKKHLESLGAKEHGLCEIKEYKFDCRIKKFEMEGALKIMKSNKALGQDGIPIEVRNCLDEV